MKKDNLYTEEKFFKKVKIAKSIYKIYTCKVLKLNNINHVGLIDYESKSIWLKEDLKPKDFKSTLIHELTHAFLNEISLRKKIKNKRIIRKLGSYEYFIDSLGFLILQNFKLKYSKGRLKCPNKKHTGLK